LNRSTVNEVIETAKEVFDTIGFTLPPFAHWTVKDWQDKGAECDEIRQCMLGWDVTDFGLGMFEQFGRTLFTLRNGSAQSTLKKDYAEKLILDPENQKPPLHFHRNKMEDIVNRGGGNILVLLYQSTPEGQPSDEEFIVQVDGVTRRHRAGQTLRLEPGQSLCIPPGLIHQFWGEEGTGVKLGSKRYSVSGEVSRVCDDFRDNCWLEPCERYCTIDEDEPARHYLVHEYPAAQ
jgi:D-lyxose ketol-isomerase